MSCGSLCLLLEFSVRLFTLVVLFGFSSSLISLFRVGSHYCHESLSDGSPFCPQSNKKFCYSKLRSLPYRFIWRMAENQPRKNSSDPGNLEKPCQFIVPIRAKIGQKPTARIIREHEHEMLGSKVFIINDIDGKSNKLF